MNDCKHGTIKGLCSVCDRKPETGNVLKQIMDEYTKAKEDSCWEEDHPIFKLAEHNDTLQATIADKDAEIAELKLWVKDRNKIMLEQAKELSLLKEVAAAIISEDPEDHKPVCCGGSIQSMCGCMGATPISMAYYELRKLLKPTINPIGEK